LGLEQLLEAKSLKVSGLADLDQRREALFRQAQLGQERQAVAAALDERFPPAGLGQLWLRLAELAEECRRINQINAATLEIGQHHLAQALHILRGEDPEASLYGADGERTQEIGNRLLAKA
jgi:flagellar biosynthesis/type III secretory pathway chaperone